MRRPVLQARTSVLISTLALGLACGRRQTPGLDHQPVDSARGVNVGTERDSAALASTAHAQLRRELERNERRWAERGPEAYEFRLRINCFCPPPLRADVQVKDGRVSEVRDSSGRPLPELAAQRFAYTVPAMFTTIRDMTSDSAWVVTAQFDSALGYPVVIQSRHRFATDAGRRLEVSQFRPLSR